MLRMVLLLVAALVTCPSVQAQDSPLVTTTELATDDRRAINSIFERWQNAWNAHDMRAFAQLFHEDATWVVWTGRIWKGRRAIEEGHVEAHRTFFRSSNQSSRPLEIRLVAPGVAIARSLTTLTGDSREPESTILGHKLLVVTQRGGVWGILYGQNTRLTPAVAAAMR